MKTRYYILETYSCGYLSTGYAVNTEAEARATLNETKAFDEPHAYIKITKQTKKWYQRYWRTVETIAEWWN